jgi:hypothetical protein
MIFLLAVLTVVLGVILFWFRSRFRFWYGLGEVAAGIAVVLLFYVPHEHPILTAEDPDPAVWAVWAWDVVGWLAGLYIFVRGMDNIGQDLPTRWRPVWHRIFSVPAPPA